MEQEIKYDILIIGAGPAGLNAALYASRANLKVGLIEKNIPGGKVTQTAKIENWLGTPFIDGVEFSQKIFNHAISYGTEYIYGDVVEIKHYKDFEQEVIMQDGSSIKSKTIIIATGMKNREPSFIKNYEKYLNRGLSYCAVCDGPLFKDKPVLVLGDGNSAFEEATYLTSFVSHVTLITKDHNFKAEKKLVDDFLNQKNITLLAGAKIKELGGENSLEYALIIDENGKNSKLEISAFFPFIGMIPSCEFAKKLNILNDNGFIKTNEKMETIVKGIYAIGDIREKEIRQIITAASDGAIAAKHISDILK